MRRPLQEILHPAELKSGDRRRYWLAVAAWFGLQVGVLCAWGGVLLLMVWLIESRIGPEKLLPYEDALLIAVLVSIIVGAILTDYLWYRFFIRSGYLSDAAAIRLLSNRAPTLHGERRHRWLGQAVLLLIYGVLGFMAIMARQWWVLVMVAPLAVWGVFLIRNSWKETDAMLAGGPVPSASRERIEYIQKALEERNDKHAEPHDG
jgi:hypothetical protein